MSTIKSNLKLQDQSLIIYMDLTYDRQRGVYCREWQVYEDEPYKPLLSRRELKEFDIRFLPADDLIAIADEIKSIIEANQYSLSLTQETLGSNSLRFIGG